MSTIIDQDNMSNTYAVKSVSVWPSALKWGAIAGGVIIVINLISYNAGMMDIEEDGTMGSTWIMSLLTWIILAALIYFGLKSYRDNENNRFLTLGTGVMWSLAFGLAAGLIAMVWNYLFFAFIAPEYLDTMQDVQATAMEEQGMGDDEIETAQTMMGFVMNPWFIALMALIITAFQSLILGLINAAILKTPPSQRAI